MHKNGVTPGGKTRWRCQLATGCNYSTTDAKAPPRKQSGNNFEPVKIRKVIPSSRRYIVTAAQNGTPVHALFFQSLLKACDVLNAELVVLPIRTKNPTSVWTASQANAEWWVDEVQPFLYNGRKQLNQNLIILGDIPVQPTATSPLSAMDALTHGESGIVGHTKLQLKSIPTGGQYPKLLTTTGACTVPNYSHSKAGKLGEFHHTLGATLVEIKGKHFYLRQINASKETGEFCVLRQHFTPRGVKDSGRYPAIALGDAHVDFQCPQVARATFGDGGMIEVFEPEEIYWHDTFDGYSTNPHHHGNPFNRLAKLLGNRESVRGEVERCVEFVMRHTPKNTVSVIVPSNHDAFLKRWIVDNDWRKDIAPINMSFYLETAQYMADNTKMGPGGTEYPDPFIYWVEKLTGKDKKILCLREPNRLVRGVQMGSHGHQGPNGARGSIKNLRRVGYKSIFGHGHGPGIDEGAMQIGTSTPRVLEYTGGPSSWMNTHGTIDPLNKRSLHHIVNGDWRI
jgi:hypothetical protein